MLPNIKRLRFVFRLEERVLSLVQLHGNLVCLTTGLQYLIKTHFETKEILKYRRVLELCPVQMSLFRVRGS